MKLSNEAKIGMMISIVVLILIGLTFKTGNFHLGEKGYTVKVHFHNIDGIDKNAPVMLNGYEVGSVKDINVVEEDGATKMLLTIWLPESVQLKEGTKAYVKNMGFMGEKYVGLSSPEKGTALLAADTTLTGQEPADLDKLLLDGSEIAANIKDVVKNLNERLTKNKESIDQIVANLDVTMKNMTSITNNVDERLKVNKEHIDGTLSHLHSSTVNLDQFTYDLKKNPWKLMFRSKEDKQSSLKEREIPKIESSVPTNNFAK